MLDKLVNQSRSPAALANAITAPSSLLLAGAAAAVAIVAGASAVLAAGAAVVAWGLKTLVGINRVKRPAPERIDPFRVGEPWRRYVQSALSSQARFQRAVNATRRGPLHERLVEIGGRVDDGVQECWTVAQQGFALESAVRELDMPATRRELAQVDADLRAAEPARRDSLGSLAEAVRSRLASAERLAAVAQQTSDRLRILDAQLDELVARAIELSVSVDGVDQLGALRTDVDSVVTEMEALRQAMEETNGALSAPPRPQPGTA